MYWASLRYFVLYRCCIAVLLCLSAFLRPGTLPLLDADGSAYHRALTAIYLLLSLAAAGVLYGYRHRFNAQLTAHVVVDVLVFTLLMHSGGGLRSGLAAMLLVSLAAAGLVGQGRMVLFFAALATLSVLFEQSYRALQDDAGVVDFVQAGLFSAGFFAVAISARLLARRVMFNEELARRRGVDLKNQILLSQRVIEEMQDGVLVLGRNGVVKQHNPRAERLLGLSNPSERKLANYSTELARGFSEWCTRGSPEPMVVRAPASGMQLRARFVSTENNDSDVLVFLEDLGRVQEQARQIKLVALGRLTANIAHEIRNPLSAIRHAGELMREDSLGPTNDRLLAIVLDNAQRVERIVSDVLELGRRDRAHPELIDLRQSLPRLVEEYTLKDDVAPGVVTFDVTGAATLYFDRSHFHQVMGNLLGNALRHSRRQAGSVCFRVRDAQHDGGVDLHVIDDGEGVDERYSEQIFEPFFTTHTRGTGLGLYIARELCEANGARLDLLFSERGADFRLSGRSHA
jgi:two-component system sensor histidine kinase PilS (NtrC family)